MRWTDIEAEQNTRLRVLGGAFYRRGDSAKGDIQLAALEEKLAEQKAEGLDGPSALMLKSFYERTTRFMSEAKAPGA